jgi:hypothetical protein
MYIMVGLLLMTLWLSQAGTLFFRLLSFGKMSHAPGIHSPMHAIAHRIHSPRIRTQLKSKLRHHSRLRKALAIEANIQALCMKAVHSFLHSDVMRSVVVVLTLIAIGASILMQWEYPLSRDAANTWWDNYNTLMDDFAAAEAATNTTGLNDDVEKALDMLNAMGTCSSPPENPENLDWRFTSSLLFSFYTMSTIGYGDINVVTYSGRIFSIFYSIFAMWVFGWFADSLSAVCELWLERMVASGTVCVASVVTRSRKAARGAVEEMEGAMEAAMAIERASVLERWGRSRAWLSVILTLGVGVVYMLVCGVICYEIENQEGGQKWSRFDTLWFVFVSCTTIGFGDMSPSRQFDRWGATLIEILLTMLGLVLVALSTGLLVTLFADEVDATEHKISALTEKLADGGDHALHSAAHTIQAHWRAKTVAKTDNETELLQKKGTRLVS